MKRFLAVVGVIFVATSLSGCVAMTALSIIDSLRMNKFDNNEYMFANNVQTYAKLGYEKCGTPEARTYVLKIYFKSQELANYSAGLPKNADTIKMVSEIAEMTLEMNDRYGNVEEPVSEVYCKMKMRNIQENAWTIQKVIGAKPR